MTTPKRIQRRRTPGWRMPDGVRFVGRGTQWGNPFSAVRGSVLAESWSEIREWPITARVPALQPNREYAVYSTHAPMALAVAAAVDLFRTLVEVRLRDQPDEAEAWLAPLRAWDLACWCPLDQPCHADVLLEVANP